MDNNEWLSDTWNTFSEKLFAFIKSKVNGKEDAEDILQNVFVKIISHVQHFDPDSNLNAWVYTITRNQIIDFYRKRKAVPLDDTMARLIAAPEEEHDDTPFCCLDGHINSLPEKYGQVIYLSEIQNMKHQQIADQLNLSLSAIKSRVVRGRELLKTKFIESCNYNINDENKLVGDSSCESCTC